MSYLDRIATCNQFNLANFLPFVIQDLTVGWVRHSFGQHLTKHPEAFSVSDSAVSFSDANATVDQRSDILATLAEGLVTEGLLRKLRGELYGVRQNWMAPNRFLLDRALVPFMGVRAYGVHLNGFVRRPDGIHLWIGKRSADRRVEPNKLDNLVAGGQPANLSLLDNLIKESEEEAGMSASLARQAVPVGTITYCFENEIGLKPDTLFCYDIALTEDFVPHNQDGEIAGFQLMHVDEALHLIKEGDSFKFNVSLVILDFAIRHGVISPDSEPNYEAMMSGLHAPQPLS